VQDLVMTDAVSAPPTGTITIEWAVGSDPNDFDTYAWSVRCEPPIPDELVSGLLTEVVKVY
jgi:hypothetical protein